MSSTPKNSDPTSGRAQLLKSKMQQHQHQRHTLLLIFFALALAILIAGVFFVVDSYQTGDVHEKWLRDIKTKIENIDQTIGSSEGYAKYSAILENIELFKIGRFSRGANDREMLYWQEQINKYAALLTEEENHPKPSQNFVCTSALADMVWIPSGAFYMGRRTLEPGDSNELPRHEVKITKGFWMSRCEISFSQWWLIGDPMFNVPRWAGYTICAYNYPACTMTWHQAMEFCQLVNSHESAAGRLPEDYEYRLPTEAEWEYAARAGTESYYYWGDDFSPEGAKAANTWDKRAAAEVDQSYRNAYAPDDRAITARPVNVGTPNPFGLQNMLGNVEEWCFDWYNPDYRTMMPPLSDTQRSSVTVDPVQNVPVMVSFGQRTVRHYKRVIDATKVVRGGSWGKPYKDCRCATRDFISPATANIGIGFRIVLAPKIRIPVGATARIVHMDGDDSAPVTDTQLPKLPNAEQLPTSAPGIF